MYRLIPIFICSLTLTLVPALTLAAGVSPAVLELSGKPGGTIESRIAIINTSASDKVYYLDLLGFSPSDETGSPRFYNVPEGDHLARWIQFGSDSVSVPAFSKGDVPFAIAIPGSIPAGGYYAAITVSQAPADVVATNGAVIEAKIASLLLLRVEGEIDESLALLDFNADGKSLGEPPKSYRYRLQNQGNVHLTPAGSIIVKNWLGQTIQQFDANKNDGRTLPSSTRAFEISAQNEPKGWMGKVSFQLRNLAIGPATATLALTYGSSGAIQSNVHFWLFPWQLLLTLAGLAFVLVVISMIVHKKIR